MRALRRRSARLLSIVAPASAAELPWILALAVALAVLSSAASAKTVSLAWEAIPGAQEYELRIERDGKAVVAQTQKDLAWKGELPPGLYDFQIRAIDWVKRPGDWSPASPLVVMPETPPRIDSPRGGAKATLYAQGSGIIFKWKPVEGVSRYAVEVRRGDRAVFAATVAGTETAVRGLQGGDYSWSVRPVIEAGGRAPASLRGRHWEGAASEAEEFSVELARLARPVPQYPLGAVPPPGSSKLRFSWKKVPGAEAYEVRLLTRAPSPREPLAAQLRRAPAYVTEDDSIALPVPGEGVRAWQVRALANLDGKKRPGAEGPESEAEFRLDRNAVFREGSGYVAISTMIAPYTYGINIPASGLSASAGSQAATLRLSGEYYPHPSWGIGAGVEETFFSINGSSFSRWTLELAGKYRVPLSGFGSGWFLAVKAGPEMRQYNFILPLLPGVPSDPSQPGAAPGIFTAFPITAWGASVGADIRKELSRRWSLGAKVSYFVPLTSSGSPSGPISLGGGANYQNLSFGLQGVCWMASRWALGVGGYLELRALSGAGKDGNNSTITMNGAYLFGSVIYRFGN